MTTRPKFIDLGEPEAIDLRYINMCVYSWPGAGKTVLWGSGDKTVAIMDSDDGIDSALAQGSSALVLPVTEYDDLVNAYEWVRHDMPKERPDIKWVTWDSLTLFQNRALIDEITVEAHDQNPKQSEDVASMREYLINMNRIGKFVRMFMGLPVNFGISCHVVVDQDPEGNLLYMPAVQGKNMPSLIAGYMNVVGYLGQTPTGTRRLLTQPTGHYFAKDRFDALQTGGKGFLDNPTLPMIDRLIKGRRAKPGPAAAAPSRPRRPVKKAAAATSTTK